MEIKITIPTREEIFIKGIPLAIVSENEKWSKNQLGEYAALSGVYIHFTGETILYVGQTSKSKAWGNFQVRLRRECQPKAASNSHLYQLLRRQSTIVKTSLYHFDEVEAMFEGEIKSMLSRERLTLILEQFMIAAYKPEGNRK